LCEGRVADSEFDDVYPITVQSVSSSFWTPISVAIRAAQLLVHRASTRVLDVGSGAGKFCIVGAAVTGATFTGIEHREHLVETARDAAHRLGIDRVRFFHGTFDEIDMTNVDAVYFYNPFEENLWGCHGNLDDTVELSKDRFIADIGRAEKLLADARIGTRVVTYHGFGGEMPAGYRRALRERKHSGFLELWVKTGTSTTRPVRSARKGFAAELAEYLSGPQEMPLNRISASAPNE
jgi:SAM-dependent methyltransferase